MVDLRTSDLPVLKTIERLVDRFLMDEILAFHAITSQSTRIPDWEICGHGPSSARGSGREGA